MNDDSVFDYLFLYLEPELRFYLEGTECAEWSSLALIVLGLGINGYAFGFDGEQDPKDTGTLIRLNLPACKFAYDILFGERGPAPAFMANPVVVASIIGSYLEADKVRPFWRAVRDGVYEDGEPVPEKSPEGTVRAQLKTASAEQTAETATLIFEALGFAPGVLKFSDQCAEWKLQH